MTHTPEQIRAAIVLHAEQCESALCCAETAEREIDSAGMAEGFHKLAAIHSTDAFAWARHLRPEGGAA